MIYKLWVRLRLKIIYLLAGNLQIILNVRIIDGVVWFDNSGMIANSVIKITRTNAIPGSVVIHNSKIVER